MTKIGNFFFLLALFSLPYASYAEVKVQSLVDRNEMAVGETFTLEVKIQSDQSLPASQPSLPTISGVDLLGQSSRSESRSSVVSTPQGIDFKNIRTRIYRYEFVANQEGKIQIDSIKVEVGGKVRRTKPIVLSVVADRGQVAQKQDPRNSPSADPFDRMEEQFNRLLQRHFGGGRPRGFGNSNGFMTPPKNKNHAFFILAEVDKTEAYKGEQIVASWYLYTQGTVRDIDTLKYPTLKGFWKEDIQISTHLNFESDTVNGLPYKRALLASYALFPIEDGKAKVDSYKAKATILRGFGFSRGETYTKASDNIPILVKPLPVDGMPSNFTGAVGQFQMLSEVADKQVVANQPFALRIRFDGRGNAKLIELPKLDLPETVEIYDIKNESKFFKNGQSFKEFEVLLIPRQAGELKLPSLRTSYFDPKTEQYAEVSAPEITIRVLPGAKQASLGEERVETEGSQVKKKQLPGLMVDFDPQHRASKPSTLPWFMGFLAALLLLLMRTVYDLGLFRKQRDLNDEVKSRFALIHGHIGKENYRAVGIDVTNAVYHVLGEVSGQGGANVELSKLLAKTAPSIRREIEGPLRKLMDYFGMIGFGPKKFIADKQITGKAKEYVKEIEGLLYKAVRLSRASEEKNES